MFPFRVGFPMGNKTLGFWIGGNEGSGEARLPSCIAIEPKTHDLSAVV
jgi:hypothetical protein